MSNIREPDFILDEMRDLERIIWKTKKLLQKYPHDNSLLLSIKQADFRKEILITELRNSLEANRYHILQYFFDTVSRKVNVDTLVRGLEGFKGLIERTSASIYQRPFEKLDIDFQSVIGGSFGLLLTITEQKLVCSDYDETLGYVFDTLDEIQKNDKNLNDIIHERFKSDKKLIRRYTNFFGNIVKSNIPIRLDWKSPTKKKHQVSIGLEKAQALYSQFREQEKETEEIVEFDGTIKGLSLIRFFIEFQSVDRKKIIKAKFEENLSEKVKSFFDVLINAKFKVIKDFNEVTEEETKKWFLIDILENH